MITKAPVVRDGCQREREDCQAANRQAGHNQRRRPPLSDATLMAGRIMRSGDGLNPEEPAEL
jgi:hypothetical protein